MVDSDSPVGSSVADHVGDRRRRSSTFRDVQDGVRPFEELARVVIMRRAHLNLTQEQLAQRMGTTKSVISRIESGRHRVSIETLRRIAEALEGLAVVGFEFDDGTVPMAQLVRL